MLIPLVVATICGHTVSEVTVSATDLTLPAANRTYCDQCDPSSANRVTNDVVPGIPTVVATVCHHPLAGTGTPVDATIVLASGKEDAKEKEHKLCPSCREFGEIAKATTKSYPQWMSDVAQKWQHHGRTSQQHKRAKASIATSYAIYMGMLSQYERAARWHQENVDPSLPLVNERGVALIPSLAYQNEPAIRPLKTPTVRFEASHQHPTRETARDRVQCWRIGPAYQPGRYADTSGEGWLDTSNPELH